MNRASKFALAQRLAICKALHISDAEYSKVLFDAGIDYAERTSFNEYMAAIKTHNPMFWRWFTNQFAITDERFLRCYQYNGDDANVLANLKKWWVDKHYPKHITVFPSEKVLDAIKEEVG